MIDIPDKEIHIAGNYIYGVIFAEKHEYTYTGKAFDPYSKVIYRRPYVLSLDTRKVKHRPDMRMGFTLSRVDDGFSSGHGSIDYHKLFDLPLAERFFLYKTSIETT